MKKHIYIFFIVLGLFFTVFVALDGVYIGLFASEIELNEYPWGTELGWSYLNKTNYMYSGLLMAFIPWLPLLVYLFAKHLTSKDSLT